jgi:hypothetical protein
LSRGGEWLRSSKESRKQRKQHKIGVKDGRGESEESIKEHIS